MSCIRLRLDGQGPLARSHSQAAWLRLQGPPRGQAVEPKRLDRPRRALGLRCQGIT
jgi:hypothetical protein